MMEDVNANGEIGMIGVGDNHRPGKMRALPRLREQLRLMVGSQPIKLQCHELDNLSPSHINPQHNPWSLIPHPLTASEDHHQHQPIHGRRPRPMDDDGLRRSMKDLTPGGP